MSDDRIERDTLIDASLDTVWSLVATPGFWVADEASVAGTVAEEGASLVAKNPDLGEVSVRVEKSSRPGTWRTAGQARSPEKSCARTTARSWSSR